MSKSVQLFARNKANQISVYIFVLTYFSSYLQSKGNAVWAQYQTKYQKPEVVVMASCTMIVYWLLSSFFAIVDFWQWPNVLFQRKVQKCKFVDWKMYGQAAIFVFVQQIFLLLPVIIFYNEYCLPWRNRVLQVRLDKLDWRSIFISFVLFVYIEEVLFYSMHVIFHQPLLYKWVHKLHHSFTAPVGVAATYAHPLENLMVNMLPLLVGPLILGSHPLVSTFWMCFAAFNSVYTHSGYDIPGLPSVNIHDFHHMNFRENYGVIGLMDFIFGTNRKFLAFGGI
eukprot:TRINITY_DN37539_c0_g1_i2.p1 TRINITY_DN37539_c0_g1~~TRINITY_DN37539_c0_g1_i2.p1  ORF type:complete len:281 (-),score=-1.03 TRINITY_DN37539_c0_g1_i2:297-1139(-)